MLPLWLGQQHAIRSAKTPRVHHPARRSSGLAARGTRLAARHRRQGNRMRRRVFLASLAAFAAAWPPSGPAQTPPRRLIGVLLAGTKASHVRAFSSFPQGMRELGYVEGRDYVIEERYAEADLTRLPMLANEIVRLKPDVIVTST